MAFFKILKKPFWCNVVILYMPTVLGAPTFHDLGPISITPRLSSPSLVAVMLLKGTQLMPFE